MGRIVYPGTVIPLGTDQAPRRTPVATALLVALTVAAYLAMRTAMADGGGAEGAARAASEWVERWGLSREGFRWWQPVSYLFVHDPSGFGHLAGNMVFLWVFGTAVEGRIGHLGFLGTYLAGGIAAGLTQAATGGAVIGASGAVSAVTGAFIALFPRARVAMFFMLSVLPVPAMLVVALYFALDLMGAFGLGRGGVGYLAHVAGTLTGLAIALTGLAAGIIRRTDMDLLYLLRQWRRRREMRSAVAGSRSAGGPWASAGNGPDADRRVRASAAGAEGAASPGPEAASARRAAALRASASEAYARGDFAAAAAAFEEALSHAPLGAEADEARLALAVIHVRKVPDRARAVAALDAIGPALPGQLRPLAEALRAELGP